MWRKETVFYWRGVFAVTFICAVTFAPLFAMAHAASLRQQEQREIPRVPEEDPNFVPRLYRTFPFQVWDGYVQVIGDGPQAPQHLTHALPGPIHVRLGDTIHIWLDLRVRKDRTVPCTIRDGVQCSFGVRGVPTRRDVPAPEWSSGHPFRVGRDNGKSFYYGYAVQRNSPLGRQVLTIRVWHGDVSLFLYQIQLEVTE